MDHKGATPKNHAVPKTSRISRHYSSSEIMDVLLEVRSMVRSFGNSSGAIGTNTKEEADPKYIVSRTVMMHGQHLHQCGVHCTIRSMA